MNNSSKNIRSLLLPASFFVPFTFYFLLFAVGGYLAYLWLIQKPYIPDTLYSDIFILFLRIAAWFIGIILALALITTIIPLLYFFAAKKSGKVNFIIDASGVLKTQAVCSNRAFI